MVLQFFMTGLLIYELYHRFGSTDDLRETSPGPQLGRFKSEHSTYVDFDDGNEEIFSHPAIQALGHSIFQHQFEDASGLHELDIRKPIYHIKCMAYDKKYLTWGKPFRKIANYSNKCEVSSWPLLGKELEGVTGQRWRFELSKSETGPNVTTDSTIYYDMISRAASKVSRSYIQAKIILDSTNVKTDDECEVWDSNVPNNTQIRIEIRKNCFGQTRCLNCGNTIMLFAEDCAKDPRWILEAVDPLPSKTKCSSKSVKTTTIDAVLLSNTTVPSNVTENPTNSVTIKAN